MARTYYDVLGVPWNATKSAIKTAFREKAKLVHPDTVQAQTANLGSYAAERLKSTLEQDFRELTEAYEVLSDSQKRKEYDDFLQRMQAASAPTPVTPPPSQATSTSPTANFCTDCGAPLVGNRCPACAKRRVSEALFSGAGALMWVLGSIFAVFVAVTLPKAWDADTCTSILTILGITVLFGREKLWGGIKQLCKTYPKKGVVAIEAAGLVVLALFVGAVNKSPAAKQTTSLAGQFNGTVRNQTAGLSADFGIAVNDNAGVLSGCMVVKSPLYGSGPLSGNVKGSDVSFAVANASIGEITFTGRLQNGAVQGTYIVRGPPAPNQEGTFSLHKSEAIGSDIIACPKSEPQELPAAPQVTKQEQHTRPAKTIPTKPSESDLESIAPESKAIQGKSHPDPFANLALHWKFAKTSNAIDAWLDRHSLYEKATFSARTKTDDLFKRETSCIVARGESFPWTGTCTYNYFWSDSSKVFGTEPTCTVTAVEKITSISMTDITGQSQKINSIPLRLTPPRCPIAGTEYGEFEVVPATESEPQDKPAPMTNLYRAPSEPQIVKPEPQITRQEPRAPCSEMVIVKSNYVLAINRPYPTSYSREAIDTANYHVGDRVTVTTRRNGRYFHPATTYSDGVWFDAADLVCPEKP